MGERVKRQFEVKYIKITVLKGVENSLKRSILIKHNDDSPDIELELGKANLVNTDAEFIYIEKMSDGKWRLTATKSIIADFSKVDCLKIHRED